MLSYCLLGDWIISYGVCMQGGVVSSENEHMQTARDYLD